MLSQMLDVNVYDIYPPFCLPETTQVFTLKAQRAHDVKMTSCQRRCDVITSHRRRYSVILTPNARWEGNDLL